MSKISFAIPGVATPVPAAPAAPAAPADAPLAVVAAPSTALVVHTPLPPPAVAAQTPAAFDDESDAFNPSDLVLPRLNIVQKVGDLSVLYPPGTLLLDGTLTLQPAPTGDTIGGSIRIVVLNLQPTYFAEKVEGGGRGDTFKTEAEVVASGGTLDWNESKRTEKPLYQRVSTALLLVEQPTGDNSAMFPHEIEGKKYALALYTMKGVAYTNAARHFKSAKRLGHLREVGYRGGWWTLAAKLEKYGTNYAYRPVIKEAGVTSPALRAAVVGLLGF
jgi:hypothetical protein